MTILSEDYLKIFVWLFFIIALKYAKKEQNWYSPFYLFMATPISYILYYDELGGIYMDELTLKTRIYAILGIYAVILGFISARKSRKKPVSGDVTENFFLVFFIGLLPTAISYIMFGNVASLEGEEMLEAREKVTLPLIGQLAYFLPASIVVACKKDKTIYILIALVFSLFAALLTVSKTAILMTVIFYMIAVTRFTPHITETKLYSKINQYKYILLPLFLIVMFIYNNNKRHEAGNTDSMEYVESGSVSEFWGTDNISQNMFLNYCYFVQPWSNLNYNIEKNYREGAIGGRSFAQFGKKLGVDTNPTPILSPSFFNTHTFMMDYYVDFGFLGGIFICYLIGYLIYSCYIRFGLSDDPLLLSFYILMAYATVMMFFSNHFNNGYLMNYFITFGFVSWFSRKILRN